MSGIKRPTQAPKPPQLTEDQIESASYVGSPEHKIEHWWDGQPGAYIDEKTGQATRPNKEKTTICPLTSQEDRNRATKWVRHALEQGDFAYHDGNTEYPDRIWYDEPETGRKWEGFVTNKTLGQYKGWPAEDGGDCGS